MNSRHILSLALITAVSVGARADLSIELASKDRVSGSISPGEIETFLVDVPAGSKIIALAKGVKTEASGKPALMVDIRDDGDALLATSGPKAKKKAKAKHKATETARYKVVVTSDDTGDYQLSVKWNSRGRRALTLDLLDSPDEQMLTFDAEMGTTVKMKVKPVRGSSASPRFDRVESSSETLDLPDPADGENGHVIASVELSEFGEQNLYVANRGGGLAGRAKAVLKIKAPLPKKRMVEVTDADIGPGSGEDEGIGAIITPGGGIVTVFGGGGAAGIDGASVDIPEGALTDSVIIVLATAPPMQGQDPAGPTVHAGPEGLQFQENVRLTIPYDPDDIEDENDLQIYTRDADGTVSLVPGPYDFDPVAGTVTISVAHFSSFRAFDAGTVAGAEPIVPGRFDLNEDGQDDLVIPANYADAGVNSETNEGGLFIFFSPLPTSPTVTATANRAIIGVTEGENFGLEHWFGDVTGDGVADLIVRCDSIGGVSGGGIRIFNGATNFQATRSDHADDTILSEGDADFFGTGVAVGNVNGDAFPDLIVGAHGADNFRGKAYVFLGDGSGHFAEDASQADVVFAGVAEEDVFGSSLATGDVNDDGVDDVVVGARQVISGTQPGAVYVFLGGAGIASKNASAADVTITGPFNDDGFGYPVRVGDVTGDGIADIVATNGADPFGNVTAGSVYVFVGKSGLVGGAADTLAFRKYTGDGSTDQLGAALRLAQMSSTHNRLSVLAIGPGHLSDAGGLWLLSDPTDGALLPTGTVSATANVVGQTGSDAFRILLDPLETPTGATVFAAAPLFGSEDQGRVYGFLTLPTGGQVANDAADVMVTGATGQRIGGDVPE